MKAPPKMAAKSPPPASVCLQWLAGSCVEWNGPPPPGSGAAPPPPPSGGGGGGKGSSSSSGASSSSEAGSTADEYKPKPKPVYKAPCNTTDCCKHFFPGDKNVGLSSMWDPSCTIIFPPHAHCLIGFMCSFCCTTPHNGACPIDNHSCDSMSAKKVKKILEIGKKQKEEKKMRKEKEMKKMKEENEVRKKKGKKPLHVHTDKPTKMPTPPPPSWVAPCHSHACCNYYW
eukprot:CAMPEP_0167760884 /NCGR_PEP_ID=MMETSP0110_2-20121227/11842_1 /TAXON_ID=629695 /ORGANISM="Gymnochlora sp., Strain CCMP2014" /LENGTH=227 /DNA_ID=CAMNT_0007647461 /DNA_START=158 /DNA_END=838 /DNA_ORIENTATION=+